LRPATAASPHRLVTFINVVGRHERCEVHRIVEQLIHPCHFAGQHQQLPRQYCVPQRQLVVYSSEHDGLDPFLPRGSRRLQDVDAINAFRVSAGRLRVLSRRFASSTCVIPQLALEFVAGSIPGSSHRQLPTNRKPSRGGCVFEGVTVRLPWTAVDRCSCRGLRVPGTPHGDVKPLDRVSDRRTETHEELLEIDGSNQCGGAADIRRRCPGRRGNEAV
jgi:hypothetical protein